MYTVLFMYMTLFIYTVIVHMKQLESILAKLVRGEKW